MKRISFILNFTSKEESYILLLLKSLNDNLYDKNHEILIFAECSTDHIIDKIIRDFKPVFPGLKILKSKLNHPYGYQGNKNLLVNLADNDIVSYLQADMVISRHYDKVIVENIKPNQILSATRIEPPLHGESPYTFTKDFGLTPEDFEYQEFLTYAETIKSDKTLDYFFAPISFYKETWQKLGGYDTIFRRSREDSDLVQRCLHTGVELKQTFLTNVYHFTCVSSRGKDWYDKQNTDAVNRQLLQQEADTIELRKFVRKWGSFNHGDRKLIKYDVDLLFPDVPADYSFVKLIEPFFSRIWLPTDTNALEVKSAYMHDEHLYANQLLEVSDTDWSKNKKYYNLTDYDNIIRYGKPKTYNCKVEFLNLEIDQTSWEFIQNIHLLIESNDVGAYECGCFRLTIDSKVEKIQKTCSNPHFDSFNYDII